MSEAHGETGIALRRLGVALGVCAVLLIVVQSLPARILGGTPFALNVERFRPWEPSDGVPVLRLFKNISRELPAFAGAGGSYRAPEQLKEAVAQQLGGSVAANLGQAAGVRAERVPRGREPGHGVVIDPEEYAGISVFLEGSPLLDPFYESLESTAREDAGAVTRVAHYGDSSIATDLLTFTMRRTLQGRFGDAGHGFMLIARGPMPYGHRDIRHRASGPWSVKQIVADQDRDGLYGYGGVAYVGSPGALTEFGTDDRGPVGRRVSRLLIYYRRHPLGGRLRIRIDGEREARELDTRGPAGDAVEMLDVVDGPHRFALRVRGGGPVRLYGVALERPGPGVVYDSLGLVGARGRRLLNYDPAHLREQLAVRDPHLVILGFGGNEADDPIGRLPRYEEEVGEVIRLMRGRPVRPCLLLAPLDQGHRNSRGRVETMPTVPRIVAAQQRAARANGCAFFNTFEAMGGEGSMREWARARPRLGLDDYRHATPAGYEVIANMLYKALLQGFADYLDRRSP